jgi:hypothetical protein
MPSTYKKPTGWKNPGVYNDSALEICDGERLFTQALRKDVT